MSILPKRILIITFIALLFQLELSGQTAGAAAAFSRLGFSAKNIAAGNTGVAIIDEGESQGYYNPAVVAYNSRLQGGISFGLLAMDRSLNFLSFSTKAGPTAGLSISFINSGVGNIDTRNSDGAEQGMISVSENLLMVSFANRFSEKLALGFNIRGYLSSLYQELPNAFSLGFDIGAVYRLINTETQAFTLGASLSNLNAKYKWDSSTIYGLDGTQTTDNIPIQLRLGFSYGTNQIGGFDFIRITGEFEEQKWNLERKTPVSGLQNGIPTEEFVTIEESQSSRFIRIGAVIGISESFTIRVGADQLSISGSNFLELARPSAGFSFSFPIEKAMLTLDYTFVIEPVIGFGTNFISLGAKF
ncbi:MAG: hypothetical protein SFU91_02130 [Chloroherpetonaceae bacterium]|nr:hypothetical protein [Chloroherpetonaceae bacterium]